MAFGIYGAYMALVYTTPVIGGFLADRLLGFRISIILGGILIMCGHISLALPSHHFFYIGLSFVICGTGFFKSSISSLVGELYHPNDPRRDSGFTIFYMGINIGALIATLLCGFVAESFGWHYGFGLAAIGMLFGLINFILGRKHLGDHGLSPNKNLLKKNILAGINLQHITILASLLAVALISILLKHEQIVAYLLYIMGIGAFIFIIGLALCYPKEQRNKLLGLLLLMILAVVFFALFEQAGSSMTLFTERSIHRDLFNWHIPTAIFQSINPFFILLLSPLFARLWMLLNQAKRSPSLPSKFATGILLAGAGFLALVMGSHYLNTFNKIHLNWVVLAYLLHTLGELCISPIGLSAVTTLSPKKWVGMLMGCWFLATAFSEYLGALIAQLTAHAPASTQMHHTVYINVFSQIGWIGVIVSLIVFICAPLIKKMTKA